VLEVVAAEQLQVAHQQQELVAPAAAVTVAKVPQELQEQKIQVEEAVTWPLEVKV
jgi:hypothetical protein